MKMINRNNYEEYFLLYADNELNAETKLAVENFVQQNTDLAVELDMLMQTKYLPEEIVFTDKDNLLRTEGNSINETNYEEYFLLYIDNELSAAKRAEVEMYVLQHPKLQNEFTILKHAVLTAETLTYGDKKDLYRTEKRRTFYIKPWRLAAAAIFTGVCAIGVWLMQKPAHINTVADNHSAQHETKQKAVIVKQPDTINQKIQQPEQTVAQQTLPVIKNTTAVRKSIDKKKNLPAEIKPDVAEHHPSPQQENEIHKNTEPVNIVKQTPDPVIENNDVAIEHVPSNKKEITTAQQPEETNEMNNGYKIYNVAYKEINTNDDNSLHVGGLDLNKTKVKGLFKKAARLFGNKNANSSEDGKLQVANFEIQTNEQ